MIIRQESILSDAHCKEILLAAEKAGYNKASLRNITRATLRAEGLSEEEAVTIAEQDTASTSGSYGGQWYDDTHRGGKTSFPKKEDLPTAWPLIDSFIRDLNNNTYNANITELDLQVAEYVPGEAGFGWHIDDPIYPTSSNLWSGRKLTAVFQLSDDTDYQGGLLMATASSIIPTVNYQVGILNSKDSNIVHKIGQVPNQEVLVISEQSIDASNVNISNSSQVNNSEITISKKIGSCMIFPSFYSHTVTPVTSGKRYSLTVWVRGPKWV